MASDWQVILTTGAVTEYAVKHFTEHCTDAEFLSSAPSPGRRIWRRPSPKPRSCGGGTISSPMCWRRWRK
jgi:hypothetical protein